MFRIFQAIQSSYQQWKRTPVSFHLSPSTNRPESLSSSTRPSRSGEPGRIAAEWIDFKVAIKEAIVVWKRRRWLRHKRASTPDPFTN